MPFLSSMLRDDRSGVDKTKKPPDGLVRHDGYITEAGIYC